MPSGAPASYSVPSDVRTSETTPSAGGAPAALPAAPNQYGSPSPLAPAAANAPVAPSSALAVLQPLTFRVGSTVTWDSNVFLQPDSTNAATAKQSDRITATYAGVRLDKAYSRQRFYLDATETASRYQSHSYLDFNALQYRGAWEWHVGSRLSGSLSASRSEALVNYSNYQNTSQRNVVTSEQRAFSLDGWVGGGWHVLAGLSHEQVTNSAPFSAQGSYRGNGVNAGLRYVARSGNSLTFVTQSTRADYVDQPLDAARLLDDGFRRTQSELQVSWRLTGKSTLSGQAGWLDYRADHFAQRDFSGAIGRLAWQWQATGKMALGVYTARDLVPFTSGASSYAVTDTLGVGPSWQITPKTSMRLDLSRAATEYRGAVLAAPGPLRSDTLRSAQLGLSWAPTRSLSLGASLRRTRQASNAAAFGYGDTVAQLSAALSF